MGNAWQQPGGEPAFERRQKRSVGFVRTCELLSFNHLYSQTRAIKGDLRKCKRQATNFGHF